MRRVRLISLEMLSYGAIICKKMRIILRKSKIPAAHEWAAGKIIYWLLNPGLSGIFHFHYGDTGEGQLESTQAAQLQAAVAVGTGSEADLEGIKTCCHIVLLAVQEYGSAHMVLDGAGNIAAKVEGHLIGLAFLHTQGQLHRSQASVSVGIRLVGYLPSMASTSSRSGMTRRAPFRVVMRDAAALAKVSISSRFSSVRFCRPWSST